jgi:hypothetical protein
MLKVKGGAKTRRRDASRWQHLRCQKTLSRRGRRPGREIQRTRRGHGKSTRPPRPFECLHWVDVREGYCGKTSVEKS